MPRHAVSYWRYKT